MKDRLFKISLIATCALVLLIMGGIIYTLAKGALPTFEEYGLGFITSSDWNPNPNNEHYGALPFIAGTLITSTLALLLCIPLSFPIAIFTGYYFKGTKVASIISDIVDMLAGVPSIVYGLWGFYTLRPIIVDLGLSQQGFGIFTASIILTIMIIPYATSLSSEFIKMVPNDLKEAAFAMGSTKLEVIQKVIFPSASSGIIASYILAMGRALGETMAVTMLIGNVNLIPTSLFSSGNTMASVIANQFGEADGIKLSSLIAIGLLLFFITVVINTIGRLIMKKLKV
ncbi:MAG: phosphate ABC transporter permease subunit PstC [Marinifilaceae bacterium]|nr:phosphate ABC transporter permease subunit PstC [Marinilabiliaceae bacterium JC040]MCT4600860.1 phosphate ABC transporter permease subunit PstC [Marinifilaceae bacterium]